MKFELFVDGGASPNPGHGGVGYALCITKGNTHVPILEGCAYLGDGITNNQAEFYALIHGLYNAQIYTNKVIVYTDSKIVYKSFVPSPKDRWIIKNDNLKELYNIAQTIISTMNSVNIYKISRDDNVLADALAGEAIFTKRGRKKIFKQPNDMSGM